MKLFILLSNKLLILLLLIATHLPTAGQNNTAEEWFESGTRKFEAGDFTGAIADYTEAIRIEPHYSGAYLYRGKAHLALGHRSEGCQDISQARLLGNTDGTWDLVREHCRDTASRWVSLSHLNVIIEDANAEVGSTGYWKLIAGQPNILRLSLDTTVLPCFNPRVTARGGYAELSPTNKFMVRVTPLGGPFELIISNEVEGIWYEMDRVRFRVIVDQATVQLLDSARAKEERQDYAGAISLYTEAIRISPSLPYAYIKRGIAKVNIQDFQGAIADYTESIRLEPWSANAYINRGLAKGKLLDYQSAIADYTEAIRLEPQNDIAHNNRGYDKLMLRDYPGAIADCSEAIRLNPENDFAYNNRGEARAVSGDYAGAVADFDEAIRLAPKHTEALCNRGKARIQLGQRDEGCQDLAKAKELGNEQAEDLIRQHCQ